jgi:hypothetical protein
MSTLTFEPTLKEFYYKWEGDSGSGTKIYECKYEDRHDSWAPVENISRFTDDLGWPTCREDNLICTSVEFKSSGVRQPLLQPRSNEASLCEITAQYAIIPAIMIWTLETRGKKEVLELGFSRNRASTGLPTDQPMAVPIYHEEICVSRLFVYNPQHIQALRYAENCVNDRIFYSPWGDTYDPEELWFKCFDRRRVPYGANGITMEHITLHFASKPLSISQYVPTNWNLYWFSASPARTSDGRPIYDGNGDMQFINTPMIDRYDPDIFPQFNFDLIVRG